MGLRFLWITYVCEDNFGSTVSKFVSQDIYMVLYFVSTQIDRMYISEDQSSECDDNLGATVRYFNSFHQTYAALIWA